MFDILIFCMKIFNSFVTFLIIFFCLNQGSIYACDTSPSIIVNQNITESKGFNLLKNHLKI